MDTFCANVVKIGLLYITKSGHTGGGTHRENPPTLKQCSMRTCFITQPLTLEQCDQIGRFIGLWATFEGLWQQLICPNLPHF